MNSRTCGNPVHSMASSQGLKISPLVPLDSKPMESQPQNPELRNSFHCTRIETKRDCLAKQLD